MEGPPTSMPRTDARARAVPPGRGWVHERAVNDLGDEVLGCGEQIVVGGAALRGITHDEVYHLCSEITSSASRVLCRHCKLVVGAAHDEDAVRGRSVVKPMPP